MQKNFVFIYPLGWSLLCATIAAGQTYTYVTFPNAQNTSLNGITESGETAGTYNLPGGLGHGFVRDASGTFTSFDVPGASSTQVTSLNASGIVVGNYQSGNEINSGYLRDLAGNVQIIHVPGATSTYVSAINSSGMITGYYFDSMNNTSGFLRDAEGSYTTFSVPDARVYPGAINSSGSIAGAAGLDGFIRNPQGEITLVPVAYTCTFTAINDNGDVAGTVETTRGHMRGFVKPLGEPTGNFRIDGNNTIVTAISQTGPAIGEIVYNVEQIYSYVRAPDGTFTSLNPHDGNSILAVGINSSGVVVGVASANFQGSMGFIYSPGPQVQ